jgi:hypothetical protein
MKRAAVTIALVAAAAFTFTPVRADAAGNVNFFLGQKNLDLNNQNVPDLEQVEDQFAFGAIMSFGATDWPVQIAADVLVTADQQTISGVDLSSTTFEFDAGVRWLIYKKGKVFPYVGAGVGLIGAAAELDFGGGLGKFDDGDASLGFWADGGVFFRLGSHFNIGVDLRYSDASVDLDFGNGIVAQDLNAGGFSYGLLVGFGW